MILDYLKKYEKQSILISILLIIVSIFLIAKPETVLSTVVTLLGIIFIVEGIINIISYITEDAEIRAFSNELILGILLAICGVIVLCNKSLFISMIPIVTGIWIIIRSIMKLQLAINLRSALTDKWGWILVSAIIMFILGAVIVANPFTAVFTMTRFIGIMLLITEICDLIESICILSKVK